MTKRETAFSAAMKKAGGPEPDAVLFRTELSRLVNRHMANGMSAASVCAELRFAEERLGEGQSRRVANVGHSTSAPSQPTNGDAAGHVDSAGNGHGNRARPSPTERDAQGQDRGAARHGGLFSAARASQPDRDGGHTTGAKSGHRVAAPVREPTPTQRKADRAAHMSAARAVLDIGWLGTDSVPGGQPYVALRCRDVRGAAERQIREGATHARSGVALYLIDRAVQEVGVPDSEMLWVDVVSHEKAREISEATGTEAFRSMAVGWLRSLHETAGTMIEGSAPNARRIAPATINTGRPQ